MKKAFLFFLSAFLCSPVWAAPPSFTVNMSEAVTVTGTPRIAVDVGGVTRYATYASGSGTSSLTFTYSPQEGDLDLDGISLSSPVDLNGGTITDLNGNPETNLTFTVPDTSGVKIDYPSLSMDFISDDYILSGTHYNSLSSFLSAAGGSFTRNSVGTYFDSTGTMQTASANIPRFDHDPVTHAAKGILIEESRTNYIPNSEFQGAAIGVPPSNVIVSAGGVGLSASVTNVGTLNGEKYIEVTFSGTYTGAGTAYPAISFGSATAAQGQTWTQRLHIISDTGTSPHTPYLELGELNASNAYLTSSSTPSVSGSYITQKRTLTNVNTAKVRFVWIAAVSNGQTINRVVRVSVPQFEQATFLTSYIPTTNGPVTRSSDVMNVPTGAWYNASATTMAGNYTSFASASYSTRLASLNDASTSNVFQLANSSSGIVLVQKVIGGSILNSTGPTYVSGTAYKVAAAMDTASGPLAVNNVLYTNTNAGIPAGISRLQIGQQSGGNVLNGWISSFKYYPARVSDTQLQLLTQ